MENRFGVVDLLLGQFQWWLAVFPGIAIFGTALAYNLLGEAVADAMDPKRT